MLQVVSLAALHVASAAILAGQQPSDTVVRVASAPRHPGTATLVPELSIGTANGAAEYMFSRIQKILPLPDGSVIIVDVTPGGGRGRGGGEAAQAVRWYDANGRYLRAIGRQGQGPGEYANISGTARLPDGRILVRDASLHRISIYAPTGEPLGSWPINEPTDATTAGTDRLMVDRAGIVYLPFSMQPAGPVRPGNPPDGFARVKPDGTVIDTLVVPRLPSVAPPPLVAGVNRQMIWAVPYGPESVWALSPLGYFVTGTTNLYAVDLRKPRGTSGGTSRPPTWQTGDPVTSIRRAVNAVPISEDERAAQRSMVESLLRRVDPAWRWTGAQVPQFKPAYRSILVGEDGRIWVIPSVPSEKYTPPVLARPAPGAGVPFREPTVYDVFEPDGTYIGRVAPPDRTTVSAMSGDKVWGITTDADDVPTVTRFRIVWR
jgi:hypothetical protein